MVNSSAFADYYHLPFNITSSLELGSAQTPCSIRMRCVFPSFYRVAAIVLPRRESHAAGRSSSFATAARIRDDPANRQGTALSW